MLYEFPCQEPLSRRSILRSGVAGVLGLSLPQLLAAQSRASARSAQAQNVLVILEQGGLSHMDSWDPKPDVVAEHRSPYRPIATTVPDVHFTSLLPRMSRVAHKLAVVRSMHHPKPVAAAHENGTQYMLSGANPNSPLEMPDLGSVVTYLIGSRCRFLPPYIMAPGNHEQHAQARNAFLPDSTRVFKSGGYDVSNPSWRVENLVPMDANVGSRLGDRRRLLATLDGTLPPADGMERFYEQAFDILTDPRVSSIFNVQNEPPKVREQYGPGHRGACYLLGRKLIEAGVRFVTVDVRWPFTPDLPGGMYLNWDHHDNIYASGRCVVELTGGGGQGRYGISHWVMMGSTDQAFAALIDDLDQRGLLANTLVCFVTEFGRTPRLSRFQGRDHWTDAFSIVFAGAGVPGGQVIGRSDLDGGYVVDEAHTPEDYAATVYEKLGIDRERPIYTLGNRPVYFGSAGQPIRTLF